MINNNININRKHLLDVTNELYRLTLLFPKREPLRYKMRRLSDEVLASLVSLPNESQPKIKFASMKDSAKNLDVLDSFFELARAQNWVRPDDLLSLQEEYSRIKGEILTLKEESDKRVIAYKEPEKIEAERTEKPAISRIAEERSKEKEKASDFSVSERQKKILEFLKKKGRAQVWEVKEALPDVSKRTLRRDFKDLLKYGYVERRGERNNTFYQAPIGQEI